MSEEETPWLKAAERFFGLLLIIIGGIAAYYTFISTTALKAFTGLFGFLSALIIFLGLILLTSKTD